MYKYAPAEGYANLYKPSWSESMEISNYDAATAPATPLPQPSNIANGTNINCVKYHNVVKGDTCAYISLKSGISLRDFFFLNPSLDKNCTGLLLDQSYCVKALGSIDTYPGYTSTWSRCTTSGCYPNQSLYKTLPNKPWTYPPLDRDGTWTNANRTRTRTHTPKKTSTPKPLASGTYDSSKYAVYLEWSDDKDEDFAKRWNGCDYIAERYRTTVKDLVEWNPSLAEADPCLIGRDFRYCVYLNKESVGTTQESLHTDDTVPTTTEHNESSPRTFSETITTDETTEIATGEIMPTKTESGSVVTPSPVATDVVSACAKFYKVEDGDYCWKVCNDNNVSQENFIEWNPSEKPDCSLVQKGYYYCISL